MTPKCKTIPYHPTTYKKATNKWVNLFSYCHQKERLRKTATLENLIGTASTIKLGGLEYSFEDYINWQREISRKVP